MASHTTSDAQPTREARFERLALSLLNCTRSGGWVRPNGTCRGWGSGKYSTRLKPLARHRGVSSKVAWPWAAQLVIANACDHVLEESLTPSARMRDAGFSHAISGENIGCTWGYMLRRAIVTSHRAMQAERSYEGGHWRNMKDGAYRSVGIGVARLGSMVAIVYDFYGGRAP